MIKQGTRVKWEWGQGTAEGEVKEIYYKDITKSISETEVKRKASRSNPAYLIKQSGGQEVLKSSSEVERAN